MKIMWFARRHILTFMNSTRSSIPLCSIRDENTLSFIPANNEIDLKKTWVNGGNTELEAVMVERRDSYASSTACTSDVGRSSCRTTSHSGETLTTSSVVCTPVPSQAQVDVETAQNYNSLPPPADDPQYDLGFCIETHLRTMGHCSVDIEALHQRAQIPADVHICIRFCEEAELDPFSQGAITLMRLIRMLHKAQFPIENIIWILALALCQFQRSLKRLSVMGRRERANVCVLHAFIAHSYLEDETCPLKVWHANIFQNYCDLSTLQDALFKLLMLQDFTLSANPQQVKMKALRLLTPVASLTVIGPNKDLNTNACNNEVNNEDIEMVEEKSNDLTNLCSNLKSNGGECTVSI